MTTPSSLLDKYAALSDDALAALSTEELLRDTQLLTGAWEARQRETAIQFYEPVQPKAMEFHASTKRELLISGGNRSSKTDTALAELSIQATGIIPYSLQGIYPKEKLTRRPIRARVVCASLTDTLEPVIKPKLQWWKWNGPGEPGSSRGHYGWMPRSCLQYGDWTKAYSEKYRTLHLADGGVIQFNSYDQEREHLAGGSFHLTIFDELPPKGHYTECKLRLLDTGGQLITAMTPPTEATGISAAWIYDDLYEPGMGGHPDIAAFEFFTEHNRILGAEELRWITAGLSEEERQVRLYGRFLHLSGLIHPLFTVAPRQWCLTCDRPVAAMTQGRCPTCSRDGLLAYQHVIEPYDWPRRWPVVFIMDPHPRKPAACTWTAVNEDDEWVQVAELEASGTAEEMAQRIFTFEDAHDFHPQLRLMDPNAAESTNDKVERGWTMRREFDRVGLRCDKAIDAFDPGVSRFNDALKPDGLLHRPRWQVFSTCEQTIYQLARYTWDEWTRQEETRSPKPKPRDKHKDFPDCFDGETEILTESGWFRFDELPESLRVATLDMESKALEFQLPTEYINYEHDGDMVEISARGVNLFVTPNHRLLVYPQQDKLSFRVAKDLCPQDTIPVGGFSEHPTAPLRQVVVGDHQIDCEDWAPFMGWYLAEGSATGTRGGKIQIPGRGYSVYIAQQPGPKADLIAMLLGRLPWKFHYTGSSFAISNKALWEVLYPLGNSFTKYIPRILLERLSIKHKHRLWRCLVAGDGWNHKGTDTVATISPRLADDMAELLARLGKSFSVIQRRPARNLIRGREVIGKHPQYYVSARKTGRASVCRAGRTRRYRTVQYCGRVFCVSVPNGTLLVRRKGLPSYVGNCARYLAMRNPTFRSLHQGAEPMRYRGNGR